MPTTLSDVNRLREDNDSVVLLATRALDQFWDTLDLTRPEAARDALLDFVPQLVAVYGQAAATVAANWYEVVRFENIGGVFAATLADSAPVEQIQKGIRYQAGHLFTDDPSVMLATLGGSIQRHIVNTSRATIRDNVGRDNARPHYARIPSGKCCSFCSLLAGRGFVYNSRESAGDFNHFHDHDRCTIAASWDKTPVVEGYDQGRFEDLYRSAKASTGSSDINVLVAEMRRQSPDSVTDGVVSSD